MDQLMEKCKLSQSSSSIEFKDSKTRSTDSCFSLTHSPTDEHSRYKNDFVEICHLGEGAFGRVMQVRNKTDQQEYAVKIVELQHPDGCGENRRLKQEAEFLASLKHPNIVRYHASWVETWLKKHFSGQQGDSQSTAEDYLEQMSQSSNDNSSSEPALVPYLFIQMELCSKTLRDEIDSKTHSHEEVARLFYEIVQGLKYVHVQGLCHRDLNPKNIFVDAEGKIKIGDFGLARLTDICYLGEQVSLLSQDIGTQAYKAPEINTTNYDCRVDLYSLGVILFEISYQMDTKMERDKVLEKLRSADLILPPKFLDCAKDWQKTIVLSLLDHSAAERLSLDQILLKLNEEYPLQDANISEVMECALLDPTSDSYSTVMHCCFSQNLNRGESVNYGTPKPNNLESRTYVSIVRFIENVFRRYGASHLPTPLLTPSELKNDSVVHLMTRDGLLVHLPHNARVNFARYVVVQEISLLTRYATLQTFEEHGKRSHPLPKYECVYDIVTSNPESLAADAQVLAVLMSVFNGVLPEQNTTNFIGLNHRDLVKAVLLSVGVKEQYLSEALELAGRNGYKDGLKLLQTHQIGENGVDMIKLEKIMSIQPCNLDPDALDSVRELLLSEIDHDCKKSAGKAIDELKEVLTYYQNVMCNQTQTDTHIITISMKWCSNVHYYSGIIFTAIRIHDDKRKDIVIADGGRYDDILNSFRAELVKEREACKKPLYGCGLSVYPLKVLEIQQDFWPPELIVVTSKRNENLEKSVYNLTKRLRMMGYSCREEFDAEVSDIETYKCDENVLCLVEYLPAGEINVTHKFTNLNQNQNTQTVSMSQFYNPTPPTIKIREENVLTMFTVNFNMDVLDDMVPGIQMVM